MATIYNFMQVTKIVADFEARIAALEGKREIKKSDGKPDAPKPKKKAE